MLDICQMSIACMLICESIEKFTVLYQSHTVRTCTVNNGFSSVGRNRNERSEKETANEGRDHKAPINVDVNYHCII